MLVCGNGRLLSYKRSFPCIRLTAFYGRRRLSDYSGGAGDAEARMEVPHPDVPESVLPSEAHQRYRCITGGSRGLPSRRRIPMLSLTVPHSPGMPAAGSVPDHGDADRAEHPVPQVSSRKQNSVFHPDILRYSCHSS